MADLIDLILDIIENQEIKEQKQLIEHLEKRGAYIPQATLSRRLSELGISKIKGVYRSLHSTHVKPFEIVSVDTAPPNLIVIHTHPGQANAIAASLDEQKQKKPSSYKGMLGTIAGDDTVLVVVSNQVSLERIKMKLLEHSKEIV